MESPRTTRIEKKELFTIDEAADIFLGAANKVTTFDSEHDKYNWLLDIVIEFKKQAKNYDKRNRTSS